MNSNHSGAGMARRVGAGIIGALLLVAATAQAQASFRVTYNIDRGNPDRTRVTGSVVNDAHLDVYDVYLTVEALGRSGKVLARGIAFVAASLPQGGSAPFTASVPVRPGIVDYRVQVTSYRAGVGAQSP